MFYGFDTDDEATATAAQIVYTVYRSRDQRKLKVTPGFWGIIERHVKSTAKRAETLGEFIERLKPRLGCSSISPKWATTGLPQEARYEKAQDGSLIELADKGRKTFLLDAINHTDQAAVLEVLYGMAALVVLLVRDRLEREKPLDLEEVR
jgi:hypothetical protein